MALGVTDPAPPLSYPTRFFVWNLVSAWIPVFFACGFAVLRRRDPVDPTGTRVAFLPNAPYLVTDLVHLDSNVELWRRSGAFFGLAYLTLWSLWPSPGPARAIVPADGEPAPDDRSSAPPTRNLTTFGTST